MESSREYYEDKLADYKRYRRGRNLYQFCKDEGIDYNWFLRAQRMYGTNPQNKKSKKVEKNQDEANRDFIQLHYIDDTVEGMNLQDEERMDEGCVPSASGSGAWTVGDVTLTDPDGNEMTIRCGSAAALGSLLSKLAVCHD